MSELKCEFCDLILKNKTTLGIHQKNAKRCIELQVKKNGVPVYSNTNKQTKAGRPPKNKSSVIETTERPVEDKLEEEEEIEEDAEIPFSSSSEEESSSSSEEDEKYERVSQSKFNNVFKKKYTTIKTEVIKNDKPAEVHTKKIEDNNTLQTVDNKIVEDFSNNLKSDLKESVDMQHTNFQQSLSQLEIRTSFIEKKMDSMISNTSDLKNSINKLSSQLSSILERLEDNGKNEKRIRSLENKMERGNITVNDIERVIDDKLDDMFHLTKKMLAEVESKNELLDIFRDNMDDIVDKHYDLYKKFKYIKEDMEDMVYPKKK